MVQKWSAASSTSLKLLTMMRARFLFLEPKLKVLLPHVVRLKRNLGIVWHVVIWKCMKIPTDLSRRRGDLWQNSSRVGKWTNNSTCYFIKHRKSFRSSRSTKKHWINFSLLMTFNDLTYHEYHANAQYAKLYTLQKTLTFSKDDEYYRGWKKIPTKNCCPW